MPVLISDPPDEDVKLWRRIIERRRKDIQDLDEETIESLVVDLWQTTGSGEHGPCDASSKVEKLLKLHLRVCSDEGKAPSQRRQSLELVKTLLGRIDNVSGSENFRFEFRVDIPNTVNDRSTITTNITESSCHPRTVTLQKESGKSGPMVPQSDAAALPMLGEAIRVSAISIPAKLTSDGKRKYSELAQGNDADIIADSSSLDNQEVTRNAASITTTEIHDVSSHRVSKGTDADFQRANGTHSTKHINSIPLDSAAPETDENMQYPATFHTLPSFVEQISEYMCRCTICNCDVGNSNLEQHINGKKHKANENIARPNQVPTVNHDEINRRHISGNSSLRSNLESFPKSLVPLEQNSARAISAASQSKLNNGPSERFDNSRRHSTVSVAHRDRFQELSNQPTETRRRASTSEIESAGSRKLQGSTESSSIATKSVNSSYIRLEANSQISEKEMQNGKNASNEEGQKSTDIISNSHIECFQRNNPKMIEGSLITIMASKDSIPTIARSLKERPKTEVSFRSQNLYSHTVKEVSSRLREWDPFWQIIINVSVGVTSKVFNLKPRPDSKSQYAIGRAAQIDLTLSRVSEDSSINICWGKKTTKNETALLLRMLPLDRGYYKKKRADTHLYPKGCFIQIDEKPIQVVQRKQQEHDPTLWKGMCKELNLVEYISDPKSRNRISMFTIDEDAYAFVISVCKYRTVDDLFHILMDQGGMHEITRLSRNDSMQKAMTFAGKQMLVVDSDEEADKEQIGKFVFSLVCPISKQPIKVPVRGKRCKHYQCFDLRSYISSNEVISGSRWRCASCENFVSLQDLEYCGLTASLLQEFAMEVTPDRDRIELCSDKSYRLLGERKLRDKKKAPSNIQPSDTVKATNSSEHIIIDLDSD